MKNETNNINFTLFGDYNNEQKYSTLPLITYSTANLEQTIHDVDHFNI